MKVSSTYLWHMVGFSGGISSKYSIYTFAITGKRSKPIGKPLTCWLSIFYKHFVKQCNVPEIQIESNLYEGSAS